MPEIKNIIFDFGGVIINIDPNRLVQMLTNSGIDNIDKVHMHLVSNNIYTGLETGHISPGQFRDAIRSQLRIPQTDKEIDDAWNAIILDIPAERVELLEGLRRNYRTFLLSNTNIMHYEYYNRYFAEAYGYKSLADLFDRAYFSHQLGMRKPDPVIYKKVLADSGIIPGETLFIDDNEENIEAALALGIHGYHLDQGEELIDLFKNGRLAVQL
jgi:putative hydrolase of the HAD superfamily